MDKEKQAFERPYWDHDKHSDALAYERAVERYMDVLEDEISRLKAKIEQLKEDRDLWRESEMKCNEYSKELLAEIERKDAALNNIISLAEDVPENGTMEISWIMDADATLTDIVGIARKALTKPEEVKALMEDSNE
jgi:uncharacterized small protein (DUF1192 family)